MGSPLNNNVSEGRSVEGPANVDQKLAHLFLGKIFILIRFLRFQNFPVEKSKVLRRFCLRPDFPISEIRLPLNYENNFFIV